MRPHVLLTSSSNNRTPDEPWTPKRQGAHWYNVSTDFALRKLGTGAGKCLVIGSPLFEASELADAGWAVTYLDVRVPPALDARLSFVQHDACELPFPDASFDAVSTACVLCHAGMGRYGDPLHDDADEKVLAEIARVLKPEGAAAVTFGPVIDAPLMLRIGDMQRVYTMDEARRLVALAGMRECAAEVLDAETGVMSAAAQPRDAFFVRPDGHFQLGNLDYLSMLLRRD